MSLKTSGLKIRCHRPTRRRAQYNYNNGSPTGPRSQTTRLKRSLLCPLKLPENFGRRNWIRTSVFNRYLSPAYQTDRLYVEMELTTGIEPVSQDYKSSALPFMLCQLFADRVRFELTSSCLTDRRLNRSAIYQLKKPLTNEWQEAFYDVTYKH